jgi:hypothetical protein
MNQSPHKCDAELLTAPFHDFVVASPIAIAPERKDDFLGLFDGALPPVDFTNTKACQ